MPACKQGYPVYSRSTSQYPELNLMRIRDRSDIIVGKKCRCTGGAACIGVWIIFAVMFGISFMYSRNHSGFIFQLLYNCFWSFSTWHASNQGFHWLHWLHWVRLTSLTVACLDAVLHAFARSIHTWRGESISTWPYIDSNPTTPLDSLGGAAGARPDGPNVQEISHCIYWIAHAHSAKPKLAKTMFNLHVSSSPWSEIYDCCKGVLSICLLKINPGSPRFATILKASHHKAIVSVTIENISILFILTPTADNL